MKNKMYVGNISYGTDENSLKDLFANYGNVVSVNIIKDRETGKSRGFGFVEMENDEEAEQAINSLNGTELHGRNLKINIAQEKKPFRNNKY